VRELILIYFEGVRDFYLDKQVKFQENIFSKYYRNHKIEGVMKCKTVE